MTKLYLVITTTRKVGLSEAKVTELAKYMLTHHADEAEAVVGKESSAPRASYGGDYKTKALNPRNDTHWKPSEERKLLKEYMTRSNSPNVPCRERKANNLRLSHELHRTPAALQIHFSKLTGKVMQTV